MTRSVAIIACSNGLGHVRRSVAVATALARRGVTATLFAREDRLVRLPGGPLTSGIDLVEFDTGTTAAALRAGDSYATRWCERLPRLDDFDLVVSDNLAEVLERRSDAVLLGQFLWSEAIPDGDVDWIDRSRRLLRQHRPLMLCTGAFAPPYFASYVRAVDVGLFRLAPVEPGVQDAILISSGLGGEAGAEARSLIEAIAADPPPVRQVLVEPELLPSASPDWLVAADFGPGMYGRLVAAVSRPGMGTVTDCLLAGVRVFAFCEPGNEEVALTARRLADLGLGEACANARAAWQAALTYLDDPAARAEHAGRCAALPGEGAEHAAAVLLGELDRACRSHA
ncbi:MAG: hypothetical protein IH986_14195 [Planctomycetes bacterium]|nr:hypothetical protein [Planctomycetota bacterium]